MKLKKDLVLREIAGQYLVMPVGRLSQICQPIHISSTAAFIWKVMAEGDFTEDSLVKRALEEYTDVTQERLQEDIRKFLELLDSNYMLDSGKPEPIMGEAKIRLPERLKKRMKKGEHG